MLLGKKVWVGFVVFVTACLLLLLSPPKSADADSSISPWLSSNPPVLDMLGELGPSDPLTPNNTSNRDCQQREVITRPKRLLPFPQSKQSHTSCVVDTGYGAFSASNYLQRPGSTVAGNMRTAGGGSTHFMPIPYSSTGITMAGGTSYGYNLYFWDNLDETLNTTAIFDSSVQHKLPAVSPESLKDKNGHLLAAEPSSMSFSANGDWIVVDIPFVATVRVNTKTREVLPFGKSVNYSIGLGPGFSTAISPDGRYAIVASRSFDILKLYDLSTCGAVPDTITKNVACNYTDLLPFFRKQVEGLTSITSVRFRSDYTLDLYVGSVIGTTTKITNYTLTPAGQQASSFQYLALGDSFASGEGAYQYKALTDTAENKCHLSQRSYPYLISSVLGYGQYESVACSGALIDDLLRIDDKYQGQAKDNKTRADRNLEVVLSTLNPGYIAQKEFVQRYQPEIVTVSAVGNDIGFADKITRCIDSDTCYSSYEDRLEIVNEVNGQFYRLVDMYTQLKNAGDPKAKIYAVGYPQIAYPDGNCAVNVHLNHDELFFANQLVSYLNSMIKTAADNAGVAFVDVEDALSGHRFCEADSWEVAVNGLTIGNDIVNLPFLHGPIGNESFHPNALGHSLLSAKILERTSNLTQPMPTPNPNAVIAEPQDGLAFLNAPRSNRTIRLIKNVTGTNGGVIKLGEAWVTDYSGLAPIIKAGSTVHAWLNSTPVDLGTFTTDADGNLTLQVILPNTVSPGFHTLHLYGQNTSNEEVDLYQTVYVTNDAGQTCIVVPASGQDADKDGQDDACDPLINQTPIVVEPDPGPPSQGQTEVPQESVPPTQQTENPQSEALDPKPPENNPETVAGTEPLTTSTPQPTPPIVATNTLPRFSNNSNTLSVSSDSPQVQGINSTITEPSSHPEEFVSTKPATTISPSKHNHLFLLLIPLTILAALPLLISKKPKKIP